MSALLIWLVFSVATALLCVVRPAYGRIFLGVFFCVMAIGVNLSLAVTDSHQFVELADGARPGVYRDLLVAIVEFNPRLIGVVAALGEIGIGLLILGKGRAVRAGLVLGILFLLAITPFGMEELPNPILAGGMGFLLLNRSDRAPRRASFPSGGGHVAPV